MSVIPNQSDRDAAAIFDESKCVVGGVYCAAWDKWFWASVAADPACDDEDRDPKPLADFPFDPADCHDIGRCPLRASAIRATKEPENDGE